MHADINRCTHAQQQARSTQTRFFLIKNTFLLPPSGGGAAPEEKEG
jgi:hypothetical protein